MEQTSTKNTSSKYLEEEVRPARNVLLSQGQKELVYHNEEELSPYHCRARQEAIGGFACHRRRAKLQADDGRLGYVFHAISYKVELLWNRTATPRKGHEKGKKKDVCCSYHLLGDSTWCINVEDEKLKMNKLQQANLRKCKSLQNRKIQLVKWEKSWF